MAWVFLVLAGFFEAGFAVSLKLSDGFSKMVPTVSFAVFAAASFWLLNLALRSLPIGTAYAVWTGLGAALTAVIGMAFLGDATNPPRIACIGLIVAGAVGLQLAGGGH